LVGVADLTPPGRISRAISSEIVTGVTKLFDFLIVNAAASGAFFIYITTILGNQDPYDNYALTALVAAILFVAGFDRLDGYEFKRLSSLRWQATRGLLVWGGSVSLLLLAAFVTKMSGNYSRGWALAWLTGTYGAFLLYRTLLWLAIRRWARKGYLARNVVVVGAGELCALLVAKLHLLPVSEVAILGIFDDRETRIPAAVRGVPVRGTIEDLLKFSRSVLIDEVIIALPLDAEHRIKSLVERLSQLPADLRLSIEPLARTFPVRGVARHGETPVIEIVDRPLRHWSALTKWFEDKILGIMFLIALAPLMGIIAVLIKLDSRGPVFFVQDRFGFNNQVIRVFKFRTMYANKGDISGAKRTVRNDPRVTRVGRVLRALSLDELPQLINVVTGEMSLVGPRPHAVTMRAGGELYYDAVGEYLHRHRVKPGITGWAQVNGLRGEIDTIEKARSRVDYDLHYIDNWTFWKDIKILFMSLRVVFVRENAY